MECSSFYVRINCIRGGRSTSFIAYSLLSGNFVLKPSYWRSIQCLEYFSTGFLYTGTKIACKYLSLFPSFFNVTDFGEILEGTDKDVTYDLREKGFQAMRGKDYQICKLLQKRIVIQLKNLQALGYVRVRDCF